MKSWRSLLIVSIFNLITAVLLFIATIFVVVNRTEKPESQELPTMRITLKDVTLDDIINGSKETKYEGNELSLEYGDNIQSFVDVQIKGRGNTSWAAPKKTFQIKFGQKVDLLNLGARKKYILIANYIDESYLRDDIMVKLAEMAGEPYRTRGEFLELYIDGDYQGLYYLMAKIDISKNSVDLRDRLGILAEFDLIHTDSEKCETQIYRDCVVVNDAVFEKNETILAEAINDFATSFNQLNLASRSKDYDRVTNLADIESFARYYLVSKLSANPDAFASSFNLYKNGKGDKIHAGPLWDYDFAYGNRNWIWSDHEKAFSPTETPILTPEFYGVDSVDYLMYNLAEIPEFQNEVKRFFIENLSGRKDELISWIIERSAKIKFSALKDEQKWRDEPKFENEVEYLIEWVSRRYDHFESIYGENVK